MPDSKEYFEFFDEISSVIATELQLNTFQAARMRLASRRTFREKLAPVST